MSKKLDIIAFFKKRALAIKKYFQKANKKRLLLLVLQYAAFAFLGLCLLAVCLFFYYTYNLPRPENFTDSPFIQSTKIYDRTGKVLLFDIYGEERREIVPFDKISDNLKYAILASEDSRFYSHGGIDFRGILRSILVDLKLQSKSQGGSTITQQLIRTVYLSTQKTLSRKVREIVLSIELERRYSKDQIFGWYLNAIPFGRNAYGAESAAQTYFSKPASDLTVAEAATLTALVPAPSYYSPYGSHKDQLLSRKDYILGRMETLGYITKDQLTQALAEPIVFAEKDHSIKAAHFVMYVEQYLMEKYGEDYLKEKGLRVYTTLDWELQEFAEKTITDADASLKARAAHNAALVSLDPKTGEILALVGSKDYFAKSYPEGCDQSSTGNCLFDPQYDVATIGRRQPGSSFKPFVYATAFKEGYTPDTLLWDVKTEFNANCSPNGNQVRDQYGLRCYSPQNFDGGVRGKVSMRSALNMSLNIPAVQTLYLAGVYDSIDTAHAMGITTLNDPERYGLSLVLGGGEVILLDMASAYGTFAAEGVHIPPVSILKIEDSSGNIIEQATTQSQKVLDTQVARLMSDVLSDNNARAPIFGVNNALYFPGYQVAAKTGTTENFKDGWTMGYTPFAVVGVWVGNNNSTPTRDFGSGLAAPIFHKVMQKLLETHPEENFTKPNPVETANPALLGQLPPTDPPHSILYYVDKKNPTAAPPQNSSQDPLYNHWEFAIQAYTGSLPPPEPDPNAPPEDPNNPNPTPTPTPEPAPNTTQ